MDGVGDVAASYHAVLTGARAAEHGLDPWRISRLKRGRILEGWQFLYLGREDRKTPAEACRFLELLVARLKQDLSLTS